MKKSTAKKSTPKNPYSKKKFDGIAAALPGSERITKTIEGLYLDGLFDGVILKDGAAFTAMYAQKDGHSDAVWVRGITGFVYDNRWYNFDQHGVGDSWYPEGFDGPLSEKEIVGLMEEQIVEAKRRYDAHVKRQAEGKTVNFGPTSRTLMSNEIEKFKQTLLARKSFSLTPGGFGTGYRFYVGHARNRFGQGVPASAEAREILGAPGLVYDEFDHD